MMRAVGVISELADWLGSMAIPIRRHEWIHLSMPGARSDSSHEECNTYLESA